MRNIVSANQMPASSASGPAKEVLALQRSEEYLDDSDLERFKYLV